MANKSKVQSVEPDIADLVNGWLKSYGLDYKLEQASLNSEIDKALDEYHSKIGGKGGNRPDTVKFIDFSNDGYTRTNRKKASVNLRDTDHAKERYQEIADIVRFGKSELNIFTEKEYYEGKIDPENGADWNQSAPIDTIPTLEDFKKTVSDYLAWEVSTLLKGKSSEDNERLGK